MLIRTIYYTYLNKNVINLEELLMHYLSFFLLFLYSSVASASEGFTLYTGIAPLELTKKELKKILTGQQSNWESGEDVVILLYPNASPKMTYVCNEIIGIPEQTYRRFIIEKAFRSGLQLMEIEAYDVRNTLKENPGAIVIFDKNELVNFKNQNIDTGDTVKIHPITITK